MSADDWIEITIETTSTTAAEMYVYTLKTPHPYPPITPTTNPPLPTTNSTLSNLSQGQTYTMKIASGPTLARVDADWVVERPYYGANLASFPTFTDVWFDEAWATRASGSLGILGAKQYQIPGLCASQEWNDQQEVSWSL